MSETKVSFGDRFQNWMMDKVMPVASKLNQQRHLAAVRDAMTLLIPLTIIGGFAILLAQPPVPQGSTNGFLLAWQAWASRMGDSLWIPYDLTMGCLSLYVAAGVAYFLAKNYDMNPITNTVSSLAVFIVISGACDRSKGALIYSYFSSSYMFGAILTAIIVVEVNHLFLSHNIKIRMPDSVPPNVTAPFEILVPFAVSLVGMMLINGLLYNLTGAGFTSLIFKIFQPLMRVTGSIPSVLIINLLITLFWFFGIHGDNMVAPVTNVITTAAVAANAEAYAAHKAIPYVYAGAASTVFGQWCFFLSLQFVILTVCHSSQLRSLVKVSLIPSCFNINEPSVFGVPTVLNIWTLIPQAVCCVLNYLVYALCANAGIVGKFVIAAPWTTPGPLNAFLATGMDWRAVVLWFILFAVNFVITVPFMKIYDKQLQKQEKETSQEQN